jgi:hypothetical protein
LRSDDADWKRCLVCGLCWCDDPLGLFINIRQLTILLGKSKSSINGAFAQLGYKNMPITFAHDNPLLIVLPCLADRIDIARQWTARRVPLKVGRRWLQARTLAEPAPHLRLAAVEACFYGCLCGCTCQPDKVTAIECRCTDCQDGLGFGAEICTCQQPVWIPNE